MSEDLLQTVPVSVGRYSYFRLGSATLSQLKAAKIIPLQNYKGLGVGSKKPDALLVFQGAVRAVVEYKQPKELRTQAQVDKELVAKLPAARSLCKVLIITDGTRTHWYNALTGKPITNADGEAIREVFNIKDVSNGAAIEHLVDEADASLTNKSSVLRNPTLLDPTPLASRLWQTIWVATGKSPVKCLYNVVELFIFKFLSDLKVLDEDYAFPRILEKSRGNPQEALKFYAKNTRRRIYELFPKGADGTTIINGTIFVNEAGDANVSQSILFAKSLEHLADYGKQFGSLTKIDKQFKTKLYESFLNQEVEALGQYFTPRVVVQSIIRMAGLDDTSFQFKGKRFCDPFCGVGGFPLELINLNERMFKAYQPKADKTIDPGFTLHGFDKGFERDDERTIILAKANMLIYLAELLFKNPQCSGQFADVFNSTFKLFRTNTGTFSHLIRDEDERYDFILSNPPYVTSGSRIIKQELEEDPDTASWYPINALGLEGISLEWVVRSLKHGGQAYLVIPDGILARVNGKRLRDFLLRECYLDALVSLPPRTFFSNAERTYVLAITKKHQDAPPQDWPVFSYLVTAIGEKLTSVKREPIAHNDLPEMVSFFRQFRGGKAATKAALESASARCKLVDVDWFHTSPHWVVDKLWSRQVLVELGIEEARDVVTHAQIVSMTKELAKVTAAWEKTATKAPSNGLRFGVFSLGDETRFKLGIGRRVLKGDLLPPGTQTGVPVYSANVVTPFGRIDRKVPAENFKRPSVLWGIDGNFHFNLVEAGKPFVPTDHCGVIRVLDENIDAEYLLYALRAKREVVSYDRDFRANIANMSRFEVSIPVDKAGLPDLAKQRELKKTFRQSTEALAKVAEAKSALDRLYKHYAHAGRLLAAT